MSYWNDYYEPSKVEEIVEEAISAIHNHIIEQAEAQVENREKSYLHYKETVRELSSQNRDLNNRISSLQKRVAELDTELHRVRFDSSTTPFQVGDKAYIVFEDWHRSHQMKCSRCNGAGYICTHVVDFPNEEVKLSCPRCQGNDYGRNRARKEDTYHEFKVKLAMIEEIAISVKMDKTGSPKKFTTYRFEGFDKFIPEAEVFEDENRAKAVADQKTEIARNQCAANTGN